MSENDDGINLPRWRRWWWEFVRPRAVERREYPDPIATGLRAGIESFMPTIDSIGGSFGGGSSGGDSSGG